MNKNLKTGINTVISLAAGILLFYFVYKSLDTEAIFEILKGDLHYQFLVLSVALSGISYYVRGIRWKMLIEPLKEETPSDFNMTMSMMIGNFANLIIPRIGEIARCGMLAKYHKVSFSKLIGTMIAERATDLLCVIAIAAITVFMQWHVFSDFFTSSSDFGSGIKVFFTSAWFWGIFLGLVVLMIILNGKIRKSNLYRKAKGVLINIWNGFVTIKNVRNVWLYILESIVVWVLFFGLFYVCIFAFDFSSNLSLGETLILFVLGCLGILAPVQGGIGAWHFMVIFGLTFFGYDKTEAGAFALIVHGIQMFAYIIFGIVAFILTPIVNNKIKQA